MVSCCPPLLTGIPRSEIWVTTKLSTVFSDSTVGYDETLKTLRHSLSLLQLDYVDLYLIHSPRFKAHRVDQWRALVKVRGGWLGRCARAMAVVASEREAARP